MTLFYKINLTTLRSLFGFNRIHYLEEREVLLNPNRDHHCFDDNGLQSPHS